MAEETCYADTDGTRLSVMSMVEVVREWPLAADRLLFSILFYHVYRRGIRYHGVSLPPCAALRSSLLLLLLPLYRIT